MYPVVRMWISGFQVGPGNGPMPMRGMRGGRGGRGGFQGRGGGARGGAAFGKSEEKQKLEKKEGDKGEEGEGDNEEVSLTRSTGSSSERGGGFGLMSF